MGRKYKNAPIIESVCEFQFERDSAWDLVTPGLVYEKLKGTFPIRRPAKALSVEISAGPEETQKQVKATDRIHFLRKDEKALVQVGPHLVAINHLKPYPSWQEFLPLVKKGFGAYCEVVEPKSIHHVGLRYINKIEIPTPSIEMQDYFQFHPLVGPNLPQDHGPFIVGIGVPYEDSRDILKIELTSASAETPDNLAAMLDLDYSLAEPGKIPLNDVFEWVEIAHNRIEEAFEGCITDRLRDILEETKE